MDLWFEMSLLEQTNLTRDGAWLELVRTKQKRLMTSSSTKDKNVSDRPVSKCRLVRLEKKARKERNRSRTIQRQERKMLANVVSLPLV
jgi:hypothetical protein